MKSFSEFTQELNEAVNDKVYFVGKDLWVASGQDSGTTTQIHQMNKSINNKRGDGSYDPIVDKVVAWSKSAKALKSNAGYSLFELPVYDVRGTNVDRKYSVWGGDVKPVRNYYMTVNKSGVTVLNFFASKSEAEGWIKQ